MTTRLRWALQGGGAHGAFTWGVLDALLADERVLPGGASGASAGAMNAVLLASGWMDGGRDGARAALRRFWQSVAAAMPAEWPVVSGNGLDVRPHPMIGWLLQWTRWLAPGNWNPLGVNPLRNIVEQQVDFERLRREKPMPLFIAATEVTNGRLRVFREHELTMDMLMASACLPSLHTAVTVDGHAYWDGGFAANPPVWEALNERGASDLMLVLLEPFHREGLPQQAQAIQSRVQDLAFQSAFLREMALIADWRERSVPRWWPAWGRQRALAHTHLHLIEPPQAIARLAPETRVVVQPGFFEALFDLGHETGAMWLVQHGSALGRRSTVDLAAEFLGR